MFKNKSQFFFILILISSLYLIQVNAQTPEPHANFLFNKVEFTLTNSTTQN